jgi:hypothetical protein
MRLLRRLVRNPFWLFLLEQYGDNTVMCDKDLFSGIMWALLSRLLVCLNKKRGKDNSHVTQILLVLLKGGSPMKKFVRLSLYMIYEVQTKNRRQFLKC